MSTPNHSSNDFSKGFKIIGTGSALPHLAVTNHDLSGFLDTSDEWINSRTGISNRNIITTEKVTDLAVSAALNALENSGVPAEEIDYIIAPTLGGDFLSPSLACMVQSAIGANCPALDINAACTGFVYGIDMASSLLSSGRCETILIVAAEGMSRLIDWTDRSTCVLFGDGAGAVVVTSKSPEGSELNYIKLNSMGQSEPLYASFPKGNFPSHRFGIEVNDTQSDHFFKMDGGEVYKFAVNSIYEGIKNALEETGMSIADISLVFLHQANKRIIDTAAKKLGLPPEKLVTNISEVGNVSAASIPIILDKANRKGIINRGDIIVLSGFGAGLTNGTAILRW